MLQILEWYKSPFTAISCLMRHSVRKPTNGNCEGGFTERYVRQNEIQITSRISWISMSDIYFFIDTVPNIREYLRWVLERFRKYLLVKFYRAPLKNCCECYWQQSNEWKTETVACIRYKSLRVDTFLSMAIRYLVGLWLRIVEASHTEKPHSVQILWMRDQLDAENSF